MTNMAEETFSGAPGKTIAARALGRGGTARVSAPVDAKVSARRNIVVILADDMRADDLRWMPTVRHTLARRGVSFTDFYASLPLCCPSRASFLTGQYAHNHGVLGNHMPYGFRAFDDSSTIATDLRSAGYRTALVGKYLNGYGDEPARGDPHGTGSLHYVPPGWTTWNGAPTVTGGSLRGSVYNYRNTVLSRNGHLLSLRGDYNTEAFGDRSVRLIEKFSARESPFFLFESYLAPHYGWPQEADDPRIWQSRMPRIKIQTPAVTRAVRGRFDTIIRQPQGKPEVDVSDKPAWVSQMPIPPPHALKAMTELARQRAEALTVLDHQVRRTLMALRRTGELANTVVVFTSDNGYFAGEHRFAADKNLPYQPAARVPLIIRGPGIPEGESRHLLATNVDLAPTIDAVGGATPDRVQDGRSLLSTARNGDPNWSRPVLIEEGPFSTLEAWVRDSVHLAGLPFPRAPRFQVGLRTRKFAYFTWATGEVELYDMRTDAAQRHNVAGNARYAAAQSRLHHLLTILKDCVGSSCRDPS
jgi:arylsulfatase A-like enzyme